MDRRFRVAREQLDSAVRDAERLILEKQEAERALAALAEGSTEQELRDLIAAAETPIDELISARDVLRQEVSDLGRVQDDAQRVVAENRGGAAVRRPPPGLGPFFGGSG